MVMCQNGVNYINEFTLHSAQLGLRVRLVTVHGYTILACNQPSKAIWPPTLSIMVTESRPEGGKVLQLESEGNDNSFHL